MINSSICHAERSRSIYSLGIRLRYEIGEEILRRAQDDRY